MGGPMYFPICGQTIWHGYCMEMVRVFSLHFISDTQISSRTHDRRKLMKKEFVAVFLVIFGLIMMTNAFAARMISRHHHWSGQGSTNIHSRTISRTGYEGPRHEATERNLHATRPKATTNRRYSHNNRTHSRNRYNQRSRHHHWSGRRSANTRSRTVSRTSSLAGRP